jgi:beta-lactamase regulating signal transducer with metallopeptidase domain
MLERIFILLLPLLALAIVSDTVALVMYFIYRHSVQMSSPSVSPSGADDQLASDNENHSSYQYLLLLWLVVSLAASVALAVFVIFAYRQWERRRGEEAWERVERRVELERGLRENGMTYLLIMLG